MLSASHVAATALLQIKLMMYRHGFFLEVPHMFTGFWVKVSLV